MRETYDYHEDQRRRARERERKLTEEASNLTTGELRRALEWQHALADHADENMRHTDYNSSTDKAAIIRAELRRRGAL